MARSTILVSVLCVLAAACGTILGIDDPVLGDGDDAGAGVDAPVGALCGNDQMDPGETCDDGNTTAGDGCSSICLDETVFCSPTLAGSFDSNQFGGVGNRIVADGDYAYITGTSSQSSNQPEMLILDVSDPSAISREGGFAFDPGNFPNSKMIGIAKNGNTIWVAGENPEYWSVDVTTTSAPTLLHQDGPNFTDGHLAQLGNTLFISFSVAERPLVIDITVPDAPNELGQMGDSGVAYGNVGVFGSHAYITGLTNGLDVVDVSNIASPSVVGRYTHSAAWNVGTGVDRIVSNNTTTAFTVPFGTSTGVHLIDVSLKSAPTFAATIAEEAKDLAMKDEFLYMPVQDGLRIYDVSDSSDPELAGSFVEIQSFATGVGIDGDRIYLTTEDGLRIITGVPGLCDAACGNSQIEYPEDCDDGNVTDGDDCPANCEDNDG